MKLLHKKWFHVLLVAILFFLLVYLISLTEFIFKPLITYIAVIAIPLAGAGILYYITRPVINFLVNRNVNRLLVILIDFLLIAGVLALAVTFLAPIIQSQISTLVSSFPQTIQSVKQWLSSWQQKVTVLPPQVENRIQQSIGNLDQYISNAASLLFGVVTQIASFLFSLILVPLFLFFMIKDREKFIPSVTRFLSPEKSESYRQWMNKVNNALGAFVLGQFIVSVCVGVMLYIGYLIIGLKFPLALAFFGMMMNIVPFLGPFIAAVPALIVAFSQNPMMAVWTVVVLFVTSQIDGNLITPNVIGDALHIHPLTIITLVLAAGSIAGIIGMLIAIPAYAVVKTSVSHFYHRWKQKQPIGDKEIM